MIIGLIGFGKVSQNIVRLMDSDDITFITSKEGRSDKTIRNIEDSNIEVLNTFKQVAANSDILISATSPKNAIKVAKEYGKYSNGIFLDLNNVSPDTTLEISNHVKNLVDGAIIGKIDSKNPILYISGPKSDELLFFNEFFKTKKISDNIGDASTLKLLRSTYTKSLSALLIETSQIARNNDLYDEFFDILTLTEGADFREKSISRIENTLSNSKRKAEELEEIIDYFSDDELIMVKAALDKLNQ